MFGVWVRRVKMGISIQLAGKKRNNNFANRNKAAYFEEYIYIFFIKAYQTLCSSTIKYINLTSMRIARFISN